MRHKELFEQVSLKDIVEHTTKLTPSGKSRWKGVSPFTDEKTPSFFVDDGKGMWYCFSSKQGGGIIKFLELTQGFDYEEAINYLYEVSGVPRPSENSKEKKQETKAEQVRRALKTAQEYFRSHKDKAVEYVISRGYPESIVDTFGLGYIPESAKYSFLDVLRSAGFSDEILIEASLANVDKKTGRVFPFFYQSRVTFPIKDKFGAIIGYTARAVDDEALPKYLNSRESVAFHKSNILWGFDTARAEIHKQDRVFISEGTFDVIMQQVAGIPAVGVLSASVSDNQLALMSRVARNIYLTFDSDSAGMSAMAKTSLMLFEKDMDCILYTIVLPGDYKDSSDFIAKEGIEAYNALVDEATPDTSALVRYFYNEALESTRSVAAAKRKVLERVAPFLNSSGTNTYRKLDIMERVCQILNLSMTSLKSWLDIKPSFGHSSKVYNKIKEVEFPAPIYERRLMTECMKDVRKISTVYSNINRDDVESYIVLKVLDIIHLTKSDSELFEALKEGLSDEEFNMVMDVYAQSSSESYDIMFLCEIFNSNRAALPKERLTNILGRKKSLREKETRASLKEIARKEIGYKNL